MKHYLGGLCLLLALPLAGCQTASLTTRNPLEVNDLQEATRRLEGATPIASRLDALTYQRLELAQNTSFIIGTSDPLIALDSGRTFVKAFELPEQPPNLTLRIQSIASDQSIFAPAALVLDKDFNVVRRVPVEAFTYEPAQFLSPDRLEASIEDIGSASGARYVVIHTTDSARQGQTRLTHPAKLYAEARGTTPPPVEDIFLPNAGIGTLVVGVRSGTVVVETPPSTIDQVPAAPGMTDDVKYRNAIEAAVSSGDIDGAMNLVRESKERGIAGMNEVFVEAIKRTQ